jgi:ABC-type phosphate transport system permease subunit
MKILRFILNIQRGIGEAIAVLLCAGAFITILAFVMWVVGSVTPDILPVQAAGWNDRMAYGAVVMMALFYVTMFVYGLLCIVRWVVSCWRAAETGKDAA